jgi:Na+/melibiose symporter-like transporter
VALYQFNIVFGILMAFVSNYFLKDSGENAWRWMLGIQVIPSVIYTILVSLVPESPRWLLEHKQDANGAKAILSQIYPANEVNEQIASIENELNQAKESASQASENIFMKKYRRPLLLAFFIAAFNQLSGINAFLYYANRIFELAGLEKSSSFLSSIILSLDRGGINL